ncbi:Hypothetical predicted protein, partial [Olea europaea subsp. europaea]
MTITTTRIAPNTTTNIAMAKIYKYNQQNPKIISYGSERERDNTQKTQTPFEHRFQSPFEPASAAKPPSNTSSSHRLNLQAPRTFVTVYSIAVHISCHS